jgi:HK97 family phage prohead protease
MKKKLIQETPNLTRTLIFCAKSFDQINHIVEGEFSHQIEDRQGDVVVQAGWDLENYTKNPVVLWAHKNSELPVAKMIEIGVNAENVLAGKMQFAVNEYPFAATVFNLVANKYLRAFSVSFGNKKYEIDRDNQLEYLIENELYEVSVVNVPADQLALAKSKGLIDDGGIEKIKSLTDEQSGAKNQGDLNAVVNLIEKSNQDTIRSVIRALTDALKAGAEADNQVRVKVEHSSQEGGNKKISVTVFNRAIKELLRTKKSLT